MRWFRKLLPSISFSVATFVSCISFLADVLDIRDLVVDAVSVALPIAGAVLPLIAIWLVVFTAMHLGAWGYEKFRYLENDGPSRDKFRAMLPDISSCSDRLLRHYEVLASPTVSDLRQAPNNGALLVGLNALFCRIEVMGIPVPDAVRNLDGTERGRQLQLAYLGALAELAESGDIGRARAGRIFASLVAITYAQHEDDQKGDAKPSPL